VHQHYNNEVEGFIDIDHKATLPLK